MKSSPSICHLLHNVKLTVKILSIFVAFLENKNFNPCDEGDRQFSFSPLSYRRFPNFDTGRFPEGGQGPF